MPDAAHLYNNPPNVDSTIGGGQMYEFFWQKKALIDARREMYFMPLADVTSMPKHMGKRIKVYHYIPLLDDRNVNDQGIDAAGSVIASTDYFVDFDHSTYLFVVEARATTFAAAVNAIETGVAVKSGAASPWTVTLSKNKLVAGTSVETAAVQAAAVFASLPNSLMVSQGSGNLYGSSKDVGTITSKLPVLSETGGRVNRVGFTRIVREGSISKLGFFTEYSQDAMDFDSDSELMQHMNRELINGAVQVSEAVLQLDLLNGAGVVVYAGDAVDDDTVDGESADPAEVSYRDLFNLSLTLDDNRTPRETEIITGSRMIDTKTIRGGRVMYIGNELQATVEEMEDPFQNQAFVHAHQYGAATTLMNGEIGSVAQFRIIVVPEMHHWEGTGAVVGTNPGYRDDGGHNYNIYPMLVVGMGSFTTIGFQTGGKGVKWKMIHKAPGEEIADRTNPYGEIGFHSIKWWYGTMILRPERLALIKTLAKV
jgi:N4-gp56 family major capsid protein